MTGLLSPLRWLQIAIVVVLSMCVDVSRAQLAGPPNPDLQPSSLPLAPLLTGAESIEGPGSINPISVLEAAGRALPGGSEPGKGKGISSTISIMIVLTVISLVPTIMLMCTCFVRIIIVLGLLKQAIGAQSIPPPQVITALAMFMTLLVMSPTLDRIHAEAVVPYQNGTISDPQQLWDAAKRPVREFMFAQIEATGNWSSLYMVLNYRGIDTSNPEKLVRADVDMISLIPAFMLSELKTAFLMGFRIYLPFLVIDMVISAILISMSMMMLPPVLISLPFKILLFVLVDGWQLVSGSLMSSFVQPGSPLRTAMEFIPGAGFG